MAEPALLSTVICTHNPRRNVLGRVMDSLRAQTLPTDAWDFLLVDNASEPPVASFLDLGWHPGARGVVEAELGISVSRQRATRETTAPLVLFIDDDNVLAPDFLEKSLEIMREFPQLGAIGPARILPEFEREPAEEVRPYTELLVNYDLPRDVWANLPHGNRSVPPTAGMTVRRPVLERWIRNNAESALRRTLGRRGNKLFTGADDVDLSLTACDLGLGTGVFTRLVMTHVYAAGREDRAYLLRLWEGNAFSDWVLNEIRGIRQPGSERAWVQDLKDFGKQFLLRRTARQFHQAIARGRRKARAYMRRYHASGGTQVKPEGL